MLRKWNCIFDYWNVTEMKLYLWPIEVAYIYIYTYEVNHHMKLY